MDTFGEESYVGIKEMTMDMKVTKFIWVLMFSVNLLRINKDRSTVLVNPRENSKTQSWPSCQFRSNALSDFQMESSSV